MFDFLKKNQKPQSKLANFSAKGSDLNGAELKKVMGGGNGSDTGATTDPTDPTPDGSHKVKSHSNQSNN